MTGSEFNFPIPMRVWITDNVDPLLAADDSHGAR